MEQVQTSESGQRRRGAKSYLLAITLGQVFALARYSLLARILGPRDLGLAATLILTAGFFDLITDTGGDRFLIQDRDGGTAEAQRLVQLMNLFRGVLVAVCLVVFCHPIAAFFGQPEIATGLMILALYPLVSSFGHMDRLRFQRRQDFRPAGINFLASEGCSMVASVGVAYFTHSFVAVAFGLIVRSIVSVIISHILANRPFRFGFDRRLAPRLARFSGPLILNGVFLYLGSHTDRIVVVDTLGAAPLGHYSAILLLIYYPSQILFRYLSVLNLPRVAATRDDPAARERAVEELGGQLILLASAMVIGFAVVAPTAIRLLFGPKFREGLELVALIGVLQSSRFLRMWPTNLAMGFGRSEIVMTNSMVRLLGVPLAFVGERWIGGMEGIAIGFTVGEMIAMALARLNVNRAIGRPLFSDFDRIAFFLLVTAMVMAWVRIVSHPVLVIAGLAFLGSAALLAWGLRRESATLAWAFRTGLRLAKSAIPRRPIRGTT
ncbi:MAG TPA: oligosaccharide flippase family protein [Caulobacteraceae bacterium]|nr:oligosaccharide flippase family protein [Caulobacteraceae bacterium]